MAGSTSTQSQNLAQIRALAQAHLTEIESEKVQEKAQLTQAETEIQYYSKTSSFDRKKLASKQSQHQSGGQPESKINQQHPPSVSQDPSTMELKKDRFRPFSEILHRLQWDPKLEVGHYCVGYLERFDGIKEMPATSWVKDFSEEEWIPMHRVRYVKRVQRNTQLGTEDAGPDLGIVWDRDARIDKFSRASTGSGRNDGTQNEDILSIDGTSVSGGMTVR